tara:strand:+ start:251 stop:1180 length:930 start_codon:yes stop_codon:yes gene_type:complete
MYLIKGISFFILISTVANVYSFVIYQKPKWENINYVGDEDLGHLLDIYIPSQGEGPFPLVITIAGSAWTDNNNKFWAYKYGGLGEELRKNGFAVVSMNHRSSYCSNFPAQIHDVKAAVRFIRGNAERFNLNKKFIGIMGYSSGGHLAAFMGTSGGLDQVVEGDKEISIEGQLGSFLNESSHVDAVVDWYGPTNFMISCTEDWNGDQTNRMRFLGGSLEKNKDLGALANPIKYVDETDPAFLIMHGTLDRVVPICQSELLYEKLMLKGIDVKFIPVQGGNHDYPSWQYDVKSETINFFKNRYSIKTEKNE